MKNKICSLIWVFSLVGCINYWNLVQNCMLCIMDVYYGNIYCIIMLLDGYIYNIQRFVKLKIRIV